MSDDTNTALATDTPAEIEPLYLPEDGDGMYTFRAPTLNWLHGNKVAKTPGVFYVKADELAEAPGAPWQPDDRFMEGTTPEMGFSTQRLKVCFIAYRAQWFVPPPKGSNEQRTRWIEGYEEGARKLVEYLVLVEGVADPMVLSLSKMSKSNPIKDILAHYRNSVLRQAARQLRRNSVPQYLFWIPIGGKLDAKGKPEYSEVTGKTGDSSFVTYPVAYWPADITECRADNTTLRRIHDEVLPQFRGWTRERRNNGEYTEVDADSYTVDDTPAVPPAGGTGRNVPRPIESDEDLPF